LEAGEGFASAMAEGARKYQGGEPVEREGTPTNRFRGQVVYFTNADVTLRRPSGAILVIDNYEIIAMSDRKKRFEPV